MQGILDEPLNLGEHVIEEQLDHGNDNACYTALRCDVVVSPYVTHEERFFGFGTIG